MKRNGYRFGLITILFYVIVVLGAFLIEGVNVFLDEKLINFTTKELIFVTIAFLIPAFIYLFIEHKVNRAKISWIILPLIVLLLVSNLIAIWRFNSSTYQVGEITFDVAITNSDKLAWTIRLCIAAILFYICFVILPKRIVKIKSLGFVYWGIVLVGLLAIGYSLLREFNNYKLIFTDDTLDVFPSIMSFFYNENTFGSMMMLAVFGIVMIHEIKPHWWHWLFVLVFLVELLITTSLTSIISTLFFLFAYLVYTAIRTIKKRPMVNAILFGLILFGVLGIISTIAILNSKNVKFASNIIHFFDMTLFQKNTSTLSGRVPLWSDALKILQDGWDWIIGKGYRQFNAIFGSYMRSQNPDYTGENVDSAFIQVLGSFGLVGLLTYLVIIVLPIGLAIKNVIKYQKLKINLACVIGIMALALYSGFETLILMFPSTNGLVAAFLFVMPVLIEHNRDAHPEMEKGLMANNEMRPHYLGKKLIPETISLFTLSLVFIGCLGMMFPAINKASWFPYYVAAIAVIGGFNLVVTFMIGIWRGKNIRKVGFALRLISLLFVLIGVPAAIFILSYIFIGFQNAVLLTGLSFGAILFLEFIVTMTIKSDATEYFSILWKNILLPHIPSLLLVGSLGAIIIFVSIFAFNVGLCESISLLISLYFIYLLMLYVLPCFGNDPRATKMLFGYLNDNYMFRQKMIIVNREID